MMSPKEDAAKRRVALKRFMADNDLKPADWARQAGLPNANAIYNFLAERADALSIKTYTALARSIPGASVSILMGDDPQKNIVEVQRDHGIMCSLVVRGLTQFECWTDNLMFEPAKQYKVSMPIKPDEAKSAYALLVGDDHAEKAYPQGTLVAVVPFVRGRGRIQTGRRVIVVRHLPDGKMNQSIREVSVDEPGKRAWLAAPAVQPRYQSAIEVPWPLTGPVDVAGETVEVTGLVIGAYTPED